MTSRLFGSFTLLCLYLSAFAHDSAAAAPSFDADKLPDSFTVSAGDYSITIAKAPAFTIRSLSYKRNPVLIPRGWMQPVLNVVGQGEAQWIGTGHGGEVVTSLELTQDGVALPLSATQHNYVGGKSAVMRLVRTSIMGPYSHRSVLELSAEGLRQSYHFEVIGDCSEVNFLYAFMLIFPKEAERYRLVMADGEVVEGTLPASDRHKRLEGHASISSLSMLFTKSGIVATFVPQEAYHTRNNDGNFFVARQRDNKFYCRVVPPKNMGATFEYHMTLRCAEATERTFSAVAEELVKQIVANDSAKSVE